MDVPGVLELIILHLAVCQKNRLHVASCIPAAVIGILRSLSQASSKEPCCVSGQLRFSRTYTKRPLRLPLALRRLLGPCPFVRRPAPKVAGPASVPAGVVAKGDRAWLIALA